MDKPLPGLILTPESGDAERAEDILNELHHFCKKHKLVIVHQPEGIVIAKVQGIFGSQARVIAHVRQVTPDLIEWRKIEWTPKDSRPQ